jgi:hypothetical protein
MSGESQKPAPASASAPKTAPVRIFALGECVKVGEEVAIVTSLKGDRVGLLVLTSAEDVFANGTAMTRAVIIEKQQADQLESLV